MSTELDDLRKEYELSNLGDRPHSISAAKLKRLIELERHDRNDPPASAAPVVDVCAWCKEAIKTAYVGLSGERYCSLGCQAQYESEVRRAGPDWERTERHRR